MYRAWSEQVWQTDGNGLEVGLKANCQLPHHHERHARMMIKDGCDDERICVGSNRIQ